VERYFVFTGDSYSMAWKEYRGHRPTLEEATSLMLFHMEHDFCHWGYIVDVEGNIVVKEDSSC
jgi:hypothetical protein